MCGLVDVIPSVYVHMRVSCAKRESLAMRFTEIVLRNPGLK
jgi:hypothetical protein